MGTPLEKESLFFDEHLSEWRQTRLGKWVLIKGSEVIGFFDTLNDASKKGFELFGLDLFMIDQILPKDVVNVPFLNTYQNA